MVYVDKEVLTLLEKLKTENVTNVDTRYFAILYSQKLMDKVEDKIVITSRGRELLEIWHMCKDPPEDPWLDSRVYTLLVLSRYLNGKIPERWRRLLEERFPFQDGRICESAFKILDILSNRKARILVTQDIAERMLDVPDGPVPTAQIEPDLAKVLESENMLVRSLFRGKYVALTPLGIRIREVLKRINIGVHEVVLSEDILKLVKALHERREELPREVLKYLADLGYADTDGSLTKAGKLLLELERFEYDETQQDKLFVLTEPERKVLYTIAELSKRLEKSGSADVTRNIVEEELQEAWTYKSFSVGLIISELEARRLVQEEEVRGKVVVKLTEKGRRIVTSKLGTVSADACKVLTFIYSYLSPDEDWISEAKEEGLVGTRGFTAIADVVRELLEEKRKPFLTEIETKLLRKLPETGYVEMSGFENSDEKIGLDKLEEKGLVRTLPGRVVILTEEGKVMKEALIGVPSGVAAPVTYELVKVLETVKSYGTEDTATLVRATGLSLDTVKTVLTIARACKFLGRASLTELGEKLLQAIELLKRRGLLEA